MLDKPERNRLAVLAGDQGSLGFFPPPHKFFFGRQLEVNLGYVWYRKDDEDSYSVGIRQGDNHEGYNPTWIERVFALYNAPPGTWQRMPVYFYLSAGSEEECREAVMAFTHGDQYKPLPGYNTMVTTSIRDSAKSCSSPARRIGSLLGYPPSGPWGSISR